MHSFMQTELQDKLVGTETFKICFIMAILTFWRMNYYFFILAHPVYKI